MIDRGTLLHITTSLLALGWATAGAAQSAGAPTEGGAAPDSAASQSEVDGSGIAPGEIVITARKVAERLSDAPVSVSVIGANQIAERGLTSIDDFAKNATGISFSQAFGRSTDRPVIRGQSNVLAGVQFGVETGAAYFVDGIYYQGDIQGFDPLSIERVEIIKGPQSALYGRNTYSGAINYITKDPTRTFTVSGRGRVAQHGETELAASASGPILGDAIGFRVGARVYRYDGEYTNLLTGKKVGYEESDSVYATIVARPFADLKIRARAELRQDDDGPLALFLQGADLNNCKPGLRSLLNRQPQGTAPPFTFQPRSAGIDLTQVDNPNQYYCGAIQARPERLKLNTDPVDIPGLGVRDGTAFDGVENKQTFLSAIADWDFGGSGWVLSSLTGWRKNKNKFGTDSDHSEAFFSLFGPVGATAEGAFANTTTKKQEDFSQEVRLTSPADQRVRGMIGAYLFEQDIKGRDLTFAFPNGNPLGADATNASSIRNKAVFALAAVDILENLTVTGEIRYATERKTVIDRQSATNIFCAGETDNAARFGFGGVCRPAGKFKAWTPRFTVDFKPTEDILFYGTWAKGVKPGGFNGTGGIPSLATNNQDLTVYDQEVAKGAEIGTKIALANRRINFGVALFRNTLEGVQLTRSIAPLTGNTTISVAVNSGNARSQGVELEFFARPMRGVNVQAGYSLADAKFTKGCDFDYFVLNSGGFQPNFNVATPPAQFLPLCDIKGKQLPLGSKHMLNGAVDWEAPLSTALRFATGLQFSWESKKYVQTDNLAYVPSAFLLNGRIGVKTDRYAISLFGRNLTDEDAPPLATRWFDYRYGNGARGLPAPPGPGLPRTGTFQGQTFNIDTGAPRGFFAPLRRGRTFGVEVTFNVR